MKRAFMLFLLLAGPMHAPAQGVPIDWAAVHNETMRGIDQLYDMRIDSAEQTFHNVVALAPGDPRGYFFLSMVYFWRHNLIGDEQDLNRFISLSDTAIDVCEQILDRDSHNAGATFFLGGMYGYRGLAWQRGGSMLKAVTDGRKGFNLLVDALEMDSTMYDAHMGLGVFRYLLAKAPRSIGWILKMLGFGGDLEGGLASLRLAATRGTYTRTEATLFLAQFLFEEHRQDEAFRLMETLTTKYPGNTLFLLAKANWYRRMDRFDDAYAMVRKALAIQKVRHLTLGGEFTYSTLAGIQFTMNDFDGARESYRTYYSMLQNKTLITNFILYRFGLTEELLGDRQRARELYRMAKPPDNKENEFERYYLHRCQASARAPLSTAESLLVAGTNELSRGRPDTARGIIEQGLTLAAGNADLRARCYSTLQDLFLQQKKYQESIDAGEHAIASGPQDESWIPPHAWFKIGQARAQLGSPGEARRAFTTAESFDGYDYQSRIETQIDEEVKKLP